MSEINVGGIVNTAIAVLPSVFELFRNRHATDNPGAPPLTDEQVKAALRDAVAQSIAKDDEIEADIIRRNPGTTGE